MLSSLFPWVTHVTRLQPAIEEAAHSSVKEAYASVGGLNKQISQIRDLLEIPLTRPELFRYFGECAALSSQSESMLTASFSPLVSLHFLNLSVDRAQASPRYTSIRSAWNGEDTSSTRYRFLDQFICTCREWARIILCLSRGNRG